MVLCGAILWFSGCGFGGNPPAPWTDQIVPDGPCYAVNLRDGLDETSTGELHDLYACLDGRGALTGFGPVDQAWDTNTRDGAAGLVVARAINDLASNAGEATADVSLAALVDEALALVEDPEPLLDLVHLGLELVWARPWPMIETTLDLHDPAAIEAGLLPPILPVVAHLAGVLLDDPASFSPLADALRSPELRDIAWTIAAAGVSDDPALAALGDGWPDDLAATRASTLSPDNDRWSLASGDSLRDAAAWLFVRQGVDGKALISDVADPLLPILADEGAAARLRTALDLQVAAGRLSALAEDVVHLTTIDSRAGRLDAGEQSALGALIRLLATTNRELTCEVPVLGLDISLGNVAVSLLGTIADLDPDTTVTGLGLFSTVLGFSLSDDALALVADQCPALDENFVEDLHALDRLSDPGHEELLQVLLGVLGALDADGGGEVDHIADVADTLSVAWEDGLVPPIEEVVRDIGDGPLVAHLVDLVPVLLAPEAHTDAAFFPEGTQPLSWETVWTILGAVLGPAQDGVAPIDRLRPVFEATLMAEGTWTAIGRLSALCAEPDALVRGVLPRLADVLAEDPTLVLADDAADLLQEPGAARPLLVLVEAEGLRAALLAPADAAGAPGPLPTVTLWAVDGTLDALLSLLRQLASLLPEQAPA